MKRTFSPSILILLLVILFTATGCDFLGDVLEFGFWTGIIFLAIIVLIVVWIVRKFRR